MPWKECHKMDERVRFVSLVLVCKLWECFTEAFRD